MVSTTVSLAVASVVIGLSPLFVGILTIGTNSREGAVWQLVQLLLPLILPTASLVFYGKFKAVGFWGLGMPVVLAAPVPALWLYFLLV